LEKINILKTTSTLHFLIKGTVLGWAR